MAWFTFLKGAFKKFAFAVPITVVFLDQVGYVAKVQGISMQPALNPDDKEMNDVVFLNKWAVRNLDVKRGDIVALICPKDPDQKIIKRIIALQGDTIKPIKSFRLVNIPLGHCWVEGDHSGHSMDSNMFGPVSMGLITAKASHIVWPPSRWQRLENLLPNSRRPIIQQDSFEFGFPWTSREGDETQGA